MSIFTETNKFIDDQYTQVGGFMQVPEEEDTKPTDTQVGGTHYKKYKIQPIEYTLGNNLNFCQGNIIKYVTRYKDKNGIQDLEKAKHYIDFLIDELKG